LFFTLPQVHGNDSTVHFFDKTIPLVDRVPMVIDDALLVKLQPYARGFFKAFDDTATIVTDATVSRAFRPNPPGRIRVNGAGFGTGAVPPFGGWVSFEWNTRNKTLGKLVTQDDEIEPEFGVKAWIEVQDIDQGIDGDTGDFTRLFRAEQIVSPFTMLLGPNVASPGNSRNIRVKLGAIDFDGQYSEQSWVLNMLVVENSEPDQFHAIYDEAFDPSDVIVEVESVNGLLEIDCSLAEQFRVRLHENVTEVRFINVPEWKVIVLEVLNEGAFDINPWPDSVMWVSGEAYVPSITGTVVAPKRDLVALETKTAGVLWAGRVSYDETAEGIPAVETPFTVTVDPNPAYHYSDTAPAVMVLATPQNNTGTVTYLWTRAPGGAGDYSGSTGNVGGPDFTVDDDTADNPTFSRVTSGADGLIWQNWLVTATDGGSGKITKTVVEVALEDDGEVPGGTPPVDRCVWEEAWLPGAREDASPRRARHVEVGDEIRVVDPVTGLESVEIVTHASTAFVPGVQVHTESGVVLTCSRSAPLATRKGQRRADSIDQLDTYVCIDGTWSWSKVTDVIDASLIRVRHITCANKYFPAGDMRGYYLAHHNIKNPPDPFEGQL
jgi:hypothetical protein